MPFRDWTEAVLKEDLPIPKNARWYQQLTPIPNRVFGENVLVAARMSDQWSPNSKEVPVLKIGDQEAQLYQAAFAMFGGSMGVRPLRDDEESWYEQIRSNFIYPVNGAFASPPTTTEGAQFPKPRPLRSVTSAGKEVVYISSEESVGSSNGELSSWSNIFAGVLRDLGIDKEEKKKKPLKKKKTNLDPEVTSKGTGTSRATAAAVKGTLHLRQSDLNDYVIISDSLEGLSRTAETKTGAGGSRSSGSAGSRNPDAGATPSVHEEEEVEEEEDVAARLVSRKRIKKKTPEKGVKFTEPEPKRPKITIKSSQAAGVETAKEKHIAEQDAVKAAEAQRKVEERQKREEERKKKAEEDKEKRAEEERRKKAEEERRIEEAKKKRALEKEQEQKKAMDKPVNVQEPEVAKATHPAHAETHDRSKIVTSKVLGRYTEEERGDAPHQAPWSLKQKDTFQEFGPCRDWFLNSFTPGEVNRQRAKTHEMLYRTFVLGEANARAANHQIVWEWRTMVRERADWEGYRERMLKRIADFERSKATFDEEKAKFDADKKPKNGGARALKINFKQLNNNWQKRRPNSIVSVKGITSAPSRLGTRLLAWKLRLLS
ncbi:hypothetical protein HanXRQr2_Chr09g0365131 [Helianthus annuus]|uniref:Uncharacterized protein n=1 Tax=Helianthus annuus TaxID=4232 RepID=A0A9K3N6P4_HELAN|nr:hypothetical protein HanXRQr2_Chr09g0365131 [Helianthus annuus]KAJ0891277.1 hypothetical protein HanPSC8_Chr09g0351821 [Helianthus annuus]